MKHHVVWLISQPQISYEKTKLNLCQDISSQSNTSKVQAWKLRKSGKVGLGCPCFSTNPPLMDSPQNVVQALDTNLCLLKRLCTIYILWRHKLLIRWWPIMLCSCILHVWFSVFASSYERRCLMSMNMMFSL